MIPAPEIGNCGPFWFEDEEGIIHSKVHFKMAEYLSKAWGVVTLTTATTGLMWQIN